MLFREAYMQMSGSRGGLTTFTFSVIALVQVWDHREIKNLPRENVEVGGRTEVARPVRLLDLFPSFDEPANVSNERIEESGWMGLSSRRTKRGRNG